MRADSGEAPDWRRISVSFPALPRAIVFLIWPSVGQRGRGHGASVGAVSSAQRWSCARDGSSRFESGAWLSPSRPHPYFPRVAFHDGGGTADRQLERHGVTYRIAPFAAELSALQYDDQDRPDAEQ